MDNNLNEQLKKLGWSSELISLVNNIAKKVDDASVKTTNITSINVRDCFDSSTLEIPTSFTIASPSIKF